MYDIINDPFEQNDLSKEYPDVYIELIYVENI